MTGAKRQAPPRISEKRISIITGLAMEKADLAAGLEGEDEAVAFLADLGKAAFKTL